MTDATLPFVPPLDASGESYLDEGHTILSWLTTTDHKRIAILYALSITVFFFIGGVAIGLVRLELISPTGSVPDLRRIQSPVHHPRHHHGVVLPGAVDPCDHGQLHLADDDRRAGRGVSAAQSDCPGISMSAAPPSPSMCLFSGGVDTGWTFYPPFSSEYSHSNVIAAAAGVFVVGFSSIATGVNFLATIHMLRCPGMTWFRLPLFAWAMYVISMVMVLATPVLAMSLLLISAERYFGLPIFDPSAGGDPLLFQHLFWFYSHPAVYIMILPAMGVVSEVFACFARRRRLRLRASWCSR